MADNKENKDKKSEKKSFSSYWFYAFIIVFLVGINMVMTLVSQPKEITLNKFEEIVRAGDVDRVEVINKRIVNIYLKPESVGNYEDVNSNNKLTTSLDPAQYVVEIGSVEIFDDRVKELREDGYELDPKYDTRENWVSTILSWVLPLLFFVAIWLFIMRRVGGGAGGPGAQIFNIGKSRATLFDNSAKVNITFQDVAGLDEAKEEVMEVVDFLKNPKKYTSLGGKIPKGVLLVGPPGTGKTLLAKAVAGEANVPFFSISGSDFVEMFVGVGASRVRDLFKQAREKAPCIVFIDEIDAIGRAS